MGGSQDDEEDTDIESTDEFDDSIFDGAAPKSEPTIHTNSYTHGVSSSRPQLRSRIRSDLQSAKNAGFKLAYHGGLLDGYACHVTLSCRIQKLGISEEAMQAWELDPHQYLILIVYYPNGYKSYDELKGMDSATARRNARFSIGISHTYKPTHTEAVQSFSSTSLAEKAREEAYKSSQEQASSIGFRNCFISGPLNQLLNDRLIQIVGYRDMGMPWIGAEEFYNDHQGMQYAMSEDLNDKYFEDEIQDNKYRILTPDHISESRPGTTSFPLVAMQFLLRHFVRCADFCLICHRRLPSDLEAIKPYVCETPLCLYQYMSLGFGPSIEHEILTQPHVVDLLISFCYSQAGTAGKLQTFPSGLSLQVPYASGNIMSRVAYHRYYAPSSTETSSSSEKPSITGPEFILAKFDRSTLELLFELPTCPVRAGDWIIIEEQQPDTKEENDLTGLVSLHCRVTSTTYYPTVSVSEPIPPPIQISVDKAADAQPKPATPVTTPGFAPVRFQVYNQNFDDLSDIAKCEVICRLLNTLPTVKEMQDYLKSSRKELRSWIDRISPATAGILRWIIASNRACIFQVDDLDASKDKQKKNADQRVHGMPGWMQFRFAMGAPDKERRFLNEVSQRKHLNFPTMFAWHGSPLHNWHSIIREGLHFKYVASGRAFGDGVYHSQHSSTSLGYSGGAWNYRSGVGNYGSGNGWARSRLHISCALALNELINVPGEFRSRSPHLVVQHLDWIQTRYLFVKVDSSYNCLDDAEMPSEVFPQDPQMKVSGDKGTALVIPAHVVSRSRRAQAAQNPSQKANKKQRIGGWFSGSSKSDPIDADELDDGKSVATDVEDLAVFMDGEAPSKAVAKTTKPKTDFVPGSLDIASLPILQPPSYATTLATKRLAADFKTLVKIQQSTPLDELGWYINPDPDCMNNLYQWIIELHSFEPTLPLAKDLKEKKMTSVVLELRFGKEFPHSPPFVRVIRPRFLGFQQGGGGHVTLGGALCMELLTNSGWSAVQSIEGVLLQVKMAMSSTDPRPARLVKGNSTDYSVWEAVDAYERACRIHGWQVPKDLRETTTDQSGVAGPAH